ncbi:unnamed protein product, partial [Clonostachys chloroleuca]
MAFISLRSISNYSTRSWAFLHNGLCSALMLGFIEQTKGLEETKDIQTQLIASLEASQEPKGRIALEYLSKSPRKLADELNLTRTTGPGQVATEAFSAPALQLRTPRFQQN